MALALLLVVFIAILPIVVIALIITAIVKHNKNDKGNSESFEKSVRSIYVYIILICLLIGIIGGVIALFNSSVNYLLPEKSYSTTNIYEKENSRNEYIVDIFTSASILVICIPLFIYHSKIAKNDTVKKVK